MVNLRRRVMGLEEKEVIETEVVFTPMTGGGTEKTSKIIDCTAGEGWYYLPFVEGDSRLASGATSSSSPTRALAYLYSDPECTQFVGCYWHTTKEITSGGGNQAYRPIIPFDKKVLLIPKGYYCKIHFSRSSVTAFTSNNAMSGYIDTYGNSVTVRS